MNAALFQLVSLEAPPWPLIGAVMLLRPVLVRFPELLRALGALLRDRSQAKLRRVIAKRIRAVPLESGDLVTMLDAVMDGAPPVNEEPAKEGPETRPGPPVAPPPREEPPPRE